MCDQLYGEFHSALQRYISLKSSSSLGCRSTIARKKDKRSGGAALPKRTACIAAVMTGEELSQCGPSAQSPLPIRTAQLRGRTLPGSLCAAQWSSEALIGTQLCVKPTWIQGIQILQNCNWLFPVYQIHFKAKLFFSEKSYCHLNGVHFITSNEVQKILCLKHWNQVFHCSWHVSFLSL